MLRELRVRNLAVIQELPGRVAPGLHVLTGEAGAGKSILVDGPLLVIRARGQLDLLDRFAECLGERERVGALVRQWEGARAALAALREEMRESARQEDLHRFQLSEIDAGRLRDGEEEELRAERSRLQHAERIFQGLQEVGALLHEDDHSATARLARAAALLRSLARLDALALGPVEGLETAVAQL